MDDGWMGDGWVDGESCSFFQPLNWRGAAGAQAFFRGTYPHLSLPQSKSMRVAWKDALLREQGMKQGEAKTLGDALSVPIADPEVPATKSFLLLAALSRFSSPWCRLN